MSKKIMIASDIHGSAFYCDLLIKKYQELNCDKMLLLGDILYHGPRNDLPKGYHPKSVISMLNEISDDIVCVQGNCDADVDQMVLNFVIHQDMILLMLEDEFFYVTHGHKFGEHHSMTASDHFLLCGHTHVPKCKVYDHYVYLNPGSVSIPKEDSDNSFMVIDGDELTWYSLLNGNVFRKESIKNLAEEMRKTQI